MAMLDLQPDFQSVSRPPAWYHSVSSSDALPSASARGSQVAEMMRQVREYHQAGTASSLTQPAIVRRRAAAYRIDASRQTYHPLIAGDAGNASVREFAYIELDDLPSYITWSYPGSSQVQAPVMAFWYNAAGLDEVTDAHSVPSSEIVDQLANLTDGWNGIGSACPSERVISDIRNALIALGSSVPQPDLEVDEDGTVALLWDREHTTYAMTFLGNGRVIGTSSPQTSDKLPWSLSVNEHGLLAARFSAIKDLQSAL